MSDRVRQQLLKIAEDEALRECVVVDEHGRFRKVSEVVIEAAAFLATLQQIRDLCGHVQDGSQMIVTISQDDATHDWIVATRVGTQDGRRTWGYGKSMDAAVANCTEEVKKREASPA